MSGRGVEEEGVIYGEDGVCEEEEGGKFVRSEVAQDHQPSGADGKDHFTQYLESNKITGTVLDDHINDQDDNEGKCGRDKLGNIDVFSTAVCREEFIHSDSFGLGGLFDGFSQGTWSLRMKVNESPPPYLR